MAASFFLGAANKRYDKFSSNAQRCRQNSWRNWLIAVMQGEHGFLCPLRKSTAVQPVDSWDPCMEGAISSFGKVEPFQGPFVSFWECKKLIVAPDLSPSLLSSCNASISHSKFISTFPHYHFLVIKTASVCRILWHTRFVDGTHASFTFIVQIN